MLYVSVDFKMVQVKGYLLASCLSCTFCGHWGERGGEGLGELPVNTFISLLLGSNQFFLLMQR